MAADMTGALITSLLGETMIDCESSVSMNITVTYDEKAQAHRVVLSDGANDASRIVSNGRDQNGSIPIQSVIDVLPQMVEEIIILNKLFGMSEKMLGMVNLQDD